MERLILFIYLLSLKAHFISSQMLFFGGCPNVTVVDNFDVNQYTGVWYEAEKYPFLFELGGKCITATYGIDGDGNVSVLNRQINQLTGNVNTITGVGRVISPAKLGVRFPSIPGSVEAPYWIIGTDYTDFAVVFSCTTYARYFSSRVVWILTRTPNPSQATLNKAYAVLSAKQITRAFMTKTNQKNCTY